MAGMVALCRALAASDGVPAQLFLFASGEELLAAPDFLNARWLDSEGQERVIFG